MFLGDCKLTVGRFFVFVLKMSKPHSEVHSTVNYELVNIVLFCN